MAKKETWIEDLDFDDHMPNGAFTHPAAPPPCACCLSAELSVFHKGMGEECFRC